MTKAMSRGDANKFLTLFCADRGWSLVALEENPKNRSQWLGTYINGGDGETKGYLLIGSRGYLWRRVSEKQWIDAFKEDINDGDARDY